MGNATYRCLRRILVDFLRRHHIEGELAVAYSGGLDSSVLALLLHRVHGDVTALLVDHHLRKESGKEALEAVQRLRTMGFDRTKILHWEHGLISGGIQEKARKARYDLLCSWCKDRGVRHLFLAHHRDDQMETLWMRRKRSSSPYGLVGMQPAVTLGQTTLWRPLLSVSRSQLEDVGQSLVYVRDPSNTDTRYERVYVRRHVPESQKLRLWKRAQKVELLLARRWKNILHHTKTGVHWRAGYVEWDRNLALSRGEWVCLLRDFCWTISGKHYPPSPSELKKLARELRFLKAGAVFSRGGVRCLGRSRSILMMRDPSHLPTCVFSETSCLWDGRFLIRRRTPNHGEATITPGGGIHSLRPKILIKTFPSVRPISLPVEIFYAPRHPSQYLSLKTVRP